MSCFRSASRAAAQVSRLGRVNVRGLSSTRSLLEQSQPSADFNTQAPTNPALYTTHQQGPLHDYASYIMASLPKFVQEFSVYKDEITLMVAPSGVIPVLDYLKNHTNCLFKSAMDITAADYPTRSQRFQVIYNLLSVRHNARIRVKTYADEVTPVPSATAIYRGADWFEREVWDMYGVFFVGHPDLRRILTDYGFEGHPLRKDFPLTGYTELRYDEEKKRVVQEPLQLTQAFRNFEGAASVWEQVGEGVDERPEHFKLSPPEPPADEEKK